MFLRPKGMKFGQAKGKKKVERFDSDFEQSQFGPTYRELVSAPPAPGSVLTLSPLPLPALPEGGNTQDSRDSFLGPHPIPIVPSKVIVWFLLSAAKHVPVRSTLL